MARYSLIGLLVFALLSYGCSLGVGEKLTPIVLPQTQDCGINEQGVDVSCTTGECYLLPDPARNATRGRCVEGDPCAAAGCPGQCRILESYPMQIACE